VPGRASLFDQVADKLEVAASQQAEDLPHPEAMKRLGDGGVNRLSRWLTPAHCSEVQTAFTSV
jgi:hypothetical protein